MRFAITGGILLLSAALITVLIFLLWRARRPQPTATTHRPALEEFEPSYVKQISILIKKDSTNPHLYLQRAHAYYHMGNFKKAEEDILRALRLDSTLAPAYLLRARLYFESQDLKRAISYLETALRLDPSLLDAYELYARILIIARQYNQAIAILNRALQQNPTYDKAYFLKGIAYKEMGDTQKAISSFEQAIQIQPQNAQAYFQIGLLLMANRNHRAEHYLKTAIQLDSSDPHIWYALGMWFQENKQYDEAIKTYKHIVNSIEPQYAQAFYALGYVYFQLDSLQKALKYFQIATKVDPQYAKAYYMMGLCYEMLADTQQALRAYRQALNLDPNQQLSLQGITRLTHE